MENEAQLVQQAKHDPQAFATLYDHYVERIYAYAQRETGDTAVAQDIVSATFEKALKNLPRYEWRGISFGAWLYKIARSEIAMHYRSQNRFLPLIGRFLSPQRVETTIQQWEQDAELHLALNKLSKRDQEILRLSFFEELSHDEIGEVLNCSTRNVAVRLHRALKRLRKQLAKQTSEVVVYDVYSG
ncbi:MAG: sigma-70 family RNA polymerase sigma factor [Candidatus Promineifilaceae bacterium]